MRFRLAAPADVRLYFNWANDPDTRRQSFSTALISLDTHEAWFARKVTDPNALLLVFETEDNIPIGQVRFEKNAAGDVIIGISVDVAFRGQGLATSLIDHACEACRQRRGNIPITAYIKPDNRASVRAFERSGFRLVSEAGADPLRLVKDWPGSGNFDQ